MSDLIDRHEAINAVGNAIADGRSWYRALKEVPSAEKTGKWTEGDMSGLLQCSSCGEFLDEFGHRWNYCPHCGTRMEIHNEDIH